MTGQGDKRHEQIKRARAKQEAINLDKQFKTANGLRVRNLKLNKVYNVIIGGKVVPTSHFRFVITGDVYTQNQWLPAEWDNLGKHVQPQYSLVQQTSTDQQTDLF